MGIGELIITGVVGALSAFGGAYLSTRGKTLATAHEIEEMLEQLKATTTAAENVKEQIKDHYGDRAVRRSLLRDRLERLAALSYELEGWLEEQRSLSRGRGAQVSCAPLDGMRMLQSLYFPTLAEQVGTLFRTVLIEQQWIIERHIAFSEDPVDGARTAEIQGRYGDVHRPVAEALVALRAAIVQLASEDLRA